MFTRIRQWLELINPAGSFKNKDDQKKARDLSTIILITFLIFIVALPLNFIRDSSDLPTSIVLLTGGLLSVFSWLLLKRGYLQVSSLFLVLIGLFVVTALCTVGQGIRDIGLFGFPIIFIFASLTLSRAIFRFSVGFALLSISWLAFGEVNGWFVTRPVMDPTNLAQLTILAVTLLGTAAAVDLLGTKLRKNLEVAQNEIVERKQAEAVNTVLFDISNAVNTTHNLSDLYRSIHNSLKSIIDVTNFFIALVDLKKNTLYFPYHQDTTDDDFSTITDFDPDDSLAGLVVSKRKPLLLNTKELEERASKKGVWGPIPLIWMGVPLIAKNEVIGVVAIQSYTDPNLYDMQDLQVLAAVSDQMAIAIDRKEAEVELAHSERDFRALFNNAHDAIILFEEPNEIVIEANQRAFDLYGYTREEFIGMSLTKISTKMEIGTKRVKEVMRKGSIKQFEITQKHKDGSLIHVEVNASRTIYRGSPVILSLNHDVTQRRQSEEERIELKAQLFQSQKLETVGTMVGGISHELNNILQSMFLYGGLIQDELPDQGSIQENMQQLLKHGERAKEIVKQILTFSRKAKVNLTAQPVHELIMEATSIAKTSFSTNIEIQQDIPTNFGSVLCDKTQIYQIVRNLCKNAEHAMGGNAGVLSVGLQQVQASIIKGHPPVAALELTIGDTGHGIDPLDLERIFDPFFTTKQFGEGTGLGLSVVHGIVEMMNGKISATSEPNVGTIFRLLFPLVDQAQEVISSHHPESQNDISKSILLVDDDDSIRDVTHIILTRKGFAVTSASDGIKALELFTANPELFELIVTDQSMPKMSGTELTREIRALKSDVPILLSTGHLGVEDNEEYSGLGITDFIQKPWTADELIERIRELDS